ncbi:MAG TPA: methyltransferase domain-containing protein [Blastocatellia bacterium]|nr:methyltransferase domain-containing protein [Blastocatellia bacterium]
MKDHVKFISTFLRKPVATGAIAPSSRWLAELMTEDMKLSQAETVVELGPGTGAFTKAIQEKIRPDALFLAIELNPQFAEELTLQFPDVNIINGSAEKFGEYLQQYGRSSADSVLCGLPWAGFSQDLQDRLLSAILKSLRPGGKFATFAYIHAAWLPPGRRFRQMLESNFSEVSMTRVVWRNLPPAFVYRCTR